MSDLCSQAQPSFLNLLRHSQRWKLLESVVCGIVGSSSPFLAAVQIINRNQACKTRPHPLRLLQPTPWWCRGVWGGGQGAVGLLCHSPGSRGIPAPTGASSPGLVRWRSGAAAGWGVEASAPWGPGRDEGASGGNMWRPAWPCASRSAHGWALGQERVRPEVEA